MTQPLTIAIDFDDTWTAHPEMWLEFAQAARRHGHHVFICTMRGACEENDEEIYGKGVPLDMQIVYAYGLTKVFACREKGIEVDIWIDDAPFFINGHSPGVIFVEKERP